MGGKPTFGSEPQGDERALVSYHDAMFTVGLEAAHAHSTENKAEIGRSDLCGCFHCRKTFFPAQIEEWTDDGQTALCPRCGIDSVIGAASGLPVHRPRFLSEMKRRWF
jgi:hypothetical protein